MLILYLHLVILLLHMCSSANGEVFKGKGKVLVSYINKDDKSGIRFIYRPEEYKKYSDLGKGWTAKFNYQGHASERDAKANYRSVLEDKDLWPHLSWDSTGKYYFHDHHGNQLDPSDWFGYVVEIYDLNGNRIYIDQNHFFEVPERIIYCEPDEKALNNQNKCSKELSGSDSGTIAAAVLVTIVLIGVTIGIVVLAKKRGWITKFPSTPTVLQRTIDSLQQPPPTAPSAEQASFRNVPPVQHLQTGLPNASNLVTAPQPLTPSTGHYSSQQPPHHSVSDAGYNQHVHRQQQAYENTAYNLSDQNP
ncbi:uncharacterized protein [Watersipora subatra]|uniref:uncharacterized protein n=1 Tax=Watersipora subatra TaxID=2589382 RepID=UPI00355B0D65